MKKSVVIGILIIFSFLLINTSSLSALDYNQTKLTNAYSCLTNQLDEDDCDTLSIEEKTFMMLANGQCKAELLDEKANSGCYSTDGCNLKKTAQAAWALNQKSTNVEDSKLWLLSQEGSPTNMEWLLQIDTTGASTCNILYEMGDTNVQINAEVDFNEDKEITEVRNGNCLTEDEGGYWLDINPNCYAPTEFQISCSQDFRSSLLFRRAGDSSGTLHILGNVNSASADGSTFEIVNSKCFNSGGTCSYEGSLWAALALGSLGEDTSLYMPYLITLANEGGNERYLPDAFLYSLTDDEEYSFNVKSSQDFNKYWQEVPSGNRYYDTAIALYPYTGQEIDEKQNTIDWLLEEDVQGDDGCWNSGSARDTAFLLYSIWGTRGTTDPGGTIEFDDTCLDAGYSCRSASSCLVGEGTVLDSYDCSNANDVCCSVDAGERCVEDKGGEICYSSQVCVGGEEDTTSVDLFAGEVCCIFGSCEAVDGNDEDNEEAQDTCTPNDGICRYSCLEGESESSYYNCEVSSQSCCKAESDDGGKTWIWILIILIILVVLGIVFKDQLRELMFRMKSGGKKSPPKGGPRRPGFPFPRKPMRSPGSMPPRRPLPPRPMHHPTTKGKKELDDVLGKLRDMGK